MQNIRYNKDNGYKLERRYIYTDGMTQIGLFCWGGVRLSLLFFILFQGCFFPSKRCIYFILFYFISFIYLFLYFLHYQYFSEIFRCKNKSDSAQILHDHDYTQFSFVFSLFQNLSFVKFSSNAHTHTLSPHTLFFKNHIER